MTIFFSFMTIFSYKTMFNACDMNTVFTMLCSHVYYEFLHHSGSPLHIILLFIVYFSFYKWFFLTHFFQKLKYILNFFPRKFLIDRFLKIKNSRKSMLKENKRLKLSFKRAHRVIQFASITCYMIKVILFSSFLTILRIRHTQVTDNNKNTRLFVHHLQYS